MGKELAKKLNLPEGLNLRQKEFAEMYVSPDRELFGNGVQCYIEIYKPDMTKKGWYKVARASASRMLTNVNLCQYINELLDNGGFNDENVDKQHLFCINQHSDLKTKMSAIKEYNVVRKRTNPDNQMPTNLTQNNYYGTDLTKDFGDYLKEKTKATIKVSEVK